MKKYVVVIDGRVEIDSAALNRAKEYASMLLHDPECKATYASVFQHVETARKVEVEWSKTPPNENGLPARKKLGKRQRGPRFSRSEKELLVALLGKYPEHTARDISKYALQNHSDSLNPNRTIHSVENKVAKLRVMLQQGPRIKKRANTH